MVMCGILVSSQGFRFSGRFSLMFAVAVMALSSLAIWETLIVKVLVVGFVFCSSAHSLAWFLVDEFIGCGFLPGGIMVMWWAWMVQSGGIGSGVVFSVCSLIICLMSCLR